MGRSVAEPIGFFLRGAGAAQALLALVAVVVLVALPGALLCVSRAHCFPAAHGLAGMGATAVLACSDWSRVSQSSSPRQMKSRCSTIVSMDCLKPPWAQFRQDCSVAPIRAEPMISSCTSWGRFG